MTIWRLAPYVLGGAALGALLLQRRSTWIPKLCSPRSRVRAVSLAAVLGTLSPLCTIGTVPVLLALLRRGLPLPAALAFLGGSSMTNPQLLLLTLGTLGLPLALWQWAASLGAGVTLGSVAAVAERAGWRLATPMSPETGARRDPSPPARRAFLRDFAAQLDRVAPYIGAGVVIGSVLHVYLPGELVGRLAGAFPSLSVILGALLSAPFYVCGGGALPAIAALVEKGLPAGAALAFFVAGPATRVQSLAALAAIVRPRVVALYVAIVLAWAMATGHALNTIYGRPDRVGTVALQRPDAQDARDDAAPAPAKPHGSPALRSPGAGSSRLGTPGASPLRTETQ